MLSAAPSLRFFYRLFLLLGATFVAFWLATGAANADEGSGPPGGVSVSSGIESKPATDPATQPTTDPVTQPTTDPVTQPTTDPVTDPATSPTTDPATTTTDPATEPTTDPATQPAPADRPGPTTQPTTDPATQPTTDPATQPTTDPATQPATDPATQPTTDPATQPTTDPATQPTTDPVSQPTTDPVTGVVEPAVVPSAVPGNPLAVANFALQLASPSVCGGVAGAEPVTSWAVATADAAAGRGDMNEGPRAAPPKGPAQAPTAPSIPSIPIMPSPPSAPGHGPASVSGWGCLAHALGVLDSPDVGATLSAERFAAGDETVPHSRAALLRTWPG